MLDMHILMLTHWNGSLYFKVELGRSHIEDAIVEAMPTGISKPGYTLTIANEHGDSVAVLIEPKLTSSTNIENIEQQVSLLLVHVVTTVRLFLG